MVARGEVEGRDEVVQECHTLLVPRCPHVCNGCASWPRTSGACVTTSSTRDGRISLCHSGRLLHLGIGRARARTEIICLVHNDQATVIDTDPGDVLTEHTLDPARTYRRKTGEPSQLGVHPFTMS